VNFPELSRRPALKTRQTTVDPTLRDPMTNGAEATNAQFTRARRQWDVSIDFLTPADVQQLEDFVNARTDGAFFGTNPFYFTDNRDLSNPRQLNVRFATLPAYNDAGDVEGEKRQNCTFTIREI
jgi:hypothetical protein